MKAKKAKQPMPIRTCRVTIRLTEADRTMFKEKANASFNGNISKLIFTAVSLYKNDRMKSKYATAQRFADLYDQLEPQRGALNRVFANNKPDGVLRTAFMQQLEQRTLLALSDALPQEDAIPRQMLAEHCAGVLILVFCWCFIKKDYLSKEAGMDALRYLVGGLYRNSPAEGGAAT